MKKALLLLVVFAVTRNSGAQELHRAPVEASNTGQNDKADATALRHYLQHRYIYAKQTAEKTTTGGSRWYFYGDAIDTSWEYTNGYQPLFFGEATIWNDTNGTVLDPGPSYHHMTAVCEGSVLDPKAALFNTDPDMAYSGQIQVNGSAAYTWDSVSISGRYLYNNSKTSVVDTLRLVFVTGTGGAITSDDIYSGWGVPAGHYMGDAFLSLVWDSVTNTADTHTYSAVYKRDILLTSADWHDTTSGGFCDTTIATNAGTGIRVGAGGLCGMSITFISGDPATKGAGILASPTPGDTLVSTWRGSGNNKYNVWQPLVAYYQTSGGTATWAPYQCPPYEPTPKDQNLGYWKSLHNTPANWDNTFTPTWGKSESGGTLASTQQYPYIGYHIVCLSCEIIAPPIIIEKIGTVTLINNIKAFPDPVTNELNISFELSQNADMMASLTNMLGQEVATQNLTNTAKGNILFDTKSLAAGVYIYTVLAGNDRYIGRVVVAH